MERAIRSLTIRPLQHYLGSTASPSFTPPPRTRHLPQNIRRQSDWIAPSSSLLANPPPTRAFAIVGSRARSGMRGIRASADYSSYIIERLATRISSVRRLAISQFPCGCVARLPARHKICLSITVDRPTLPQIARTPDSPIGRITIIVPPCIVATHLTVTDSVDRNSPKPEVARRFRTRR